MEYSITLDPSLDAFIQSKLDAGRYGSASDVVSAALRSLVESDADARLLRSLAQAEAGDDRDMDEVFDKLERDLEEVEQRRTA